MKRVAITKARRTLADYARVAHKGTLVVTSRGRPMAAVIPLRDVDLESLALSTNPDFIALITRARTRLAKTGGLSLEQMKRRWRVRPRRASSRTAANLRRSQRRAPRRSR